MELLKILPGYANDDKLKKPCEVFIRIFEDPQRSSRFKKQHLEDLMKFIKHVANNEIGNMGERFLKSITIDTEKPSLESA